MTLRIQLLIPTLDRSGAEKQLALLAAGLPRDEFEVEVIALSRGGPYAETLRSAGIPVTIIGKRWKFDPLALRRLQKHLIERQPDIVHTWLFAANAYGRLAAGPRGSAKWRVLVSERCVDVWKARWQTWLDRRLIARTDHMTGNSQAVVDFYQALGVPSDRLSVIRNGIEPPPASTRSRDSLYEEFHVPRGARLLGYVGRLAPQKRLTDLIWATELLNHLDHSAYFLIVGDGPQRAELERFAQAIRIEDRVIFTGHRLDAAELLPHFDLVWLASDFEGQSNSLMEAMSAGVPVIASDIAPNRELVTHEQTGLIVPVTQKADYARAANRLLSDPLLSRRLAESARELMQTQFTVERMVAEHAALYRRLAAAR